MFALVTCCQMFCFFFFKQKTAYEMRISDWSSDVCSSDLGRITAIHYYPGVRALETTLDVEQGWPGHRPGQFAFAVSDPAEGPHPYTIASAWSEQERRITFIAKGLGDHTRRLPRSEEHTSELQSLMRISYAVFCLKNKN